jgi:hypothetical protein
MASTQTIRALAVAGVVGAVVAVIALFIEYQYGLRTASGGSAAYKPIKRASSSPQSATWPSSSACFAPGRGLMDGSGASQS